MRRYVEKPRAPSGISYAAQYTAGGPLDELLAVARCMGRESALAEVPELQVVVVRYQRSPDYYPDQIDYVVVPDGHYLVHSKMSDSLYESDPETLAREHEPLPPSATDGAP